MPPKRKQEKGSTNPTRTSKRLKQSAADAVPPPDPTGRIESPTAEPKPARKRTKRAPAGKGSQQQPPSVAPDASGVAKERVADETSTLPESDDSSHNYWLMKAEPDSRIENGVDVKFSIDDLRAATAPEPWDGVRNHVAKNNMKAMKKGDLGFFYHSNTKVPGIAGILEIEREAAVDESAFNAKHPYYDLKSSRDKPRWFCVHVAFHSKFPELISLKALQAHRDGPLRDMQLLKQSRLSVSKVSKQEWDFINGMLKAEQN